MRTSQFMISSRSRDACALMISMKMNKCSATAAASTGTGCIRAPKFMSTGTVRIRDRQIGHACMWACLLFTRPKVWRVIHTCGSHVHARRFPRSKHFARISYSLTGFQNRFGFGHVHTPDAVVPFHRLCVQMHMVDAARGRGVCRYRHPPGAVATRWGQAPRRARRQQWRN